MSEYLEGLEKYRIEVPDGCKHEKYSWKEIAKHDNTDSCWLVIDGKVYDVTCWLKEHPGGELTILNCCGGRDATDAFLTNHPIKTREKILPNFQIGVVEDYTVSEVLQDFRGILGKLEVEGWYKTEYTYYLKMAVWILFLFGSSLMSVMGYFGSSFFVRAVVGGFFMGFTWQQGSFIGHDLGHSSVTHNKSRDELIGYFYGNIFLGIGSGWWKASHHVHHVATNRADADCDIQYLPVMALDECFLAPGGVLSTYHEKLFKFEGFAKFLVKYQHYLFYIVLVFARFNLYVQSIKILVSSASFKRRRGISYPFLELAFLGLFFVWYLSLVYFMLPTFAMRIVFVLVSHAVASVLHIQITLSHFARDIIKPEDTAPLTPQQIDEKGDSFPSHQIRTSLDVSCPEYMDWFHGGLQFQVVHHLFPRLPRHSHRLLVPIIQAFAKKHGFDYRSVGFVEGNLMVRNRLREMSIKAEHVSSFIADMANMNG